MIYLASPYWHEDPEVRAVRVHANLVLTRKLMLAHPEINCYSPLAYGYGFPAGISEERWLAHGIAMLHICTELVVLMLPNWEKSKGVAAEIAYAEAHHIPVFYLPVPDEALSDESVEYRFLHI